jgi:hypothetical protein
MAKLAPKDQHQLPRLIDETYQLVPHVIGIMRRGDDHPLYVKALTFFVNTMFKLIECTHTHPLLTPHIRQGSVIG